MSHRSGKKQENRKMRAKEEVKGMSFQRAKTSIEKPIKYAVKETREQIHSGSILLGIIAGAGLVIGGQVLIASAKVAAQARARDQAVYAKMRANIRPVTTAKIASEPKQVLFI
jgi:hypothetical protein